MSSTAPGPFSAVFFGIASDQEYSQPDGRPSRPTGAGAYPTLPPTFDSSGLSTVPDATVASYHMAALPWLNCVPHSEKPDVAAPGSP